MVRHIGGEIKRHSLISPRGASARQSFSLLTSRTGGRDLLLPVRDGDEMLEA
jgi:hypothetical protein